MDSGGAASLQQMQDAALPLFFTGDEYMNTQWYSEEGSVKRYAQN